MMLFGLLFIQGMASEETDSFPFFPIIDNHHSRSVIRNYFDMKHIDIKSFHGKILRNIVLNLKQKVNVSYNIDKLEQLISLKNGNAAFILGIIYEFGLFDNNIDEIKACRYYELGSRYGNSESKSSLAYFYRYGIGGLQQNIQKATQLTKESMGKCVFSALRMATMLYEKNQIENAVSIILPIATLTINNSTFFDFYFNSDHDIIKFDKLSLPSKRTESKDGELKYLQALSSTGDHYAKLQLLQKSLGNRDYSKASEIATEEYLNIEMAMMSSKTNEDIQSLDNIYGPYYSIISLMKKYGIMNMNQKQNEDSANKDKKSIFKNSPKNEKRIISLTSNQLMQKALKIGDPLAFTELAYLYLTKGNEQVAEVGKSLLMAAVNVSYIPAIHAYGVSLYQGWKPFTKDIDLAKQCFMQCYKEKKYLPSMLNLALIFYTYEKNPEKAFLILKELVELSFLFRDAQVAYKATINGDYQQALQYYKRLSDAGSNNASYNVYQLYKQKGDFLFKNNENDYANKYKNYYDFDKNEYNNSPKQENIDDIRKKWLVESSPDAYYEYAEQLMKEGKDIQQAIECYKRGSKTNAFSAFKAGMLLMHESPGKSLNYFNRAQNLNDILKLPVSIMKIRIFIENIPYLFKNSHTIFNIVFCKNKLAYIEPFDLFMAKCTYRILNVLTYVIPFLVMYFLIIIRMNILYDNNDRLLFNHDVSDSQLD